MSNVIQIKHGSATEKGTMPSGKLAPYELGYANNCGLFIGGPLKDNGDLGDAIPIVPEKVKASEISDKSVQTEGFTKDAEEKIKAIEVKKATEAGSATNATNATNATKADNLLVDEDEEGNKTYKSFNEIKSSLLKTIYPVDSIYISLNDKNPETFLGGTWERIQDRFLLAAGSTYRAGTTGGEAEVTLKIENLPSHDHGTWQRDPNYTSTGNSEYQAMVDPAGTGDVVKGWAPSLSKTEESSGKKEMKTKTTGNNIAHNNMPPYLAVYMWKRIA